MIASASLDDEDTDELGVDCWFPLTPTESPPALGFLGFSTILEEITSEDEQDMSKALERVL